jgi:hypothetical protein
MRVGILGSGLMGGYRLPQLLHALLSGAFSKPARSDPKVIAYKPVLGVLSMAPPAWFAREASNRLSAPEYGSSENTPGMAGDVLYF